MKTEPTEKEKLIERLKVEISNCQDDLDAASWAYEEGILISKREAVALLDLAQSSPKIKQLEWLDDNFPYRGCSVFVDYIISNKIGSRYTVVLDIGTGIYINSFKTIDEAKAAAQADFEKRVMECLDL